MNGFLKTSAGALSPGEAGSNPGVKTGGVKLIGAAGSFLGFCHSEKPHGSVSKPCTPGEHQNSW
jgi:hypothetical protein